MTVSEVLVFYSMWFLFGCLTHIVCVFQRGKHNSMLTGFRATGLGFVAVYLFRSTCGWSWQSISFYWSTVATFCRLRWTGSFGKTLLSLFIYCRVGKPWSLRSWQDPKICCLSGCHEICRIFWKLIRCTDPYQGGSMRRLNDHLKSPSEKLCFGDPSQNEHFWGIFRHLWPFFQAVEFSVGRSNWSLLGTGNLT